MVVRLAGVLLLSSSLWGEVALRVSLWHRLSWADAGEMLPMLFYVAVPSF